MNSTRYPGKVLHLIDNKPLLKHLVDRVKKSKKIDKIIVITSTNELDNRINDFCSENNINCFRGNEDDVLDRMASSLKANTSKFSMVIYGDCPFIDYKIVDYIIDQFFINSDDYDFIGNNLKRK